MRFEVQITPYEGLTKDFIFRKTFDSQLDYTSFKDLCKNRKRFGFLASLVIPVRTDNGTNFSKDFFLPSLFNTALKTDNLGLKIFKCIVCPVFDLLFLAVRCITLIPRFYYNRAFSKENHPLYKELLENDVAEDALRQGHLFLQIAQGEDVDGELRVKIEGETFNFMNLPTSVGRISKRIFATPDMSRELLTGLGLDVSFWLPNLEN